MKKIIVSLLIMASAMASALFAAPTMAPNFSATTITGEEVSLEKYLESKKPLLVYFTASWCPVCAKNWPSLNEIYKTYKDKANVLAISIDPTDTNVALTKLAKKHNLVFPMLAGNPGIMINFGVNSQATTVLVNSKGEITLKKSGHITLEEYKKIINNALENE